MDRGIMIGGNTLIKRGALTKIGGFNADFTPPEEIEALFDTTVLELPVPSPFDIIVNESAADLEQLGEKTQELCTKTDVLIKKVGLSISDIVSGGRRSLNAANFFKTQTEGRHWYKKTLKVQKK
jgi:hypothetical protein